MSDFSAVCVGDQVEIILLSNHTKQSSGEVFKILFNDDPNKIVVVLKNGDKGRVIRIINSMDVIKKRIMTEGQYTENKEKFGESVMRDKVIPQTVQSFLNSEGGYLYIGIKDTGELDQRLVGLGYDFELIDPEHNTTNDKLCDELERKIMDSLYKHLESTAQMGQLVKIHFVDIDDVQIVEIEIKPSPQPWFFKHITKKNKPKQFDLCFDDEKTSRSLDDFYIRFGGAKKLLETHSEFYKYAKSHFTN